MAIVVAEDKPHRKLDHVGEIEVDLRRLAREVAMGIVDVDVILEKHELSARDWERIADNPRFKALLREEMITWHSGLNTRQRVEIKTWAMIEEALPQLWNYLHDDRFADAAKVSLLSALQKQVGIGQKDAALAGDGGQRISITINTGTDQVKVERDVTPQVIEGVADDGLKISGPPDEGE